MTTTAVCGVVIVADGGDNELTQIAGSRLTSSFAIANEPLLRHALRSVRDASAAHAVLVGPPEHADEALTTAGEVAGLTLSWVDCAAGSAAAAVAAAADEIAGRVALVHFADAHSPAVLRPLVDFLRQSSADVVLSNMAHGTEDAVVDLGERRRHRREASTASREPSLIAALSPQAVVIACEAAAEGASVAARDLAGLVAEAGGTVIARDIGETWVCAGNADGALECNRLVLDALTSDLAGVDLSAARVEGRVRIHPSAVLDRTIVRGPAVIGAGASLVDTFVGPYTSIGDDVRLEGTEIEYSIVMQGAEIRYPGRRLEASLVGQEATIARDFALPTSLRLRVGRRAEISLA